MDAIAPSDDAEAKRATLAAVLRGRLGNEGAEALMTAISTPDQVQLIERLLRSTAGAARQEASPQSRWDRMAPLDKLATAHRNAAMSEAGLAGKKGDR